MPSIRFNSLMITAIRLPLQACETVIQKRLSILQPDRVEIRALSLMQQRVVVIILAEPLEIMNYINLTSLQLSLKGNVTSE